MNEDIPPPVVVGKAPDGSQRIPEEVPTSPAPQIPREAPEAPLIDFGPPEPSPASRSEEPRPPSPRPEEPSPPEPSSHRAETNEGLQIILGNLMNMAGISHYCIIYVFIGRISNDHFALLD